MEDEKVKYYKCYMCKNRKPEGSFSVDSSKPSGRMSRCKVCDDAHKKRRYDRRQDGRRELVTRAKARPCADCSGTFPFYQMDLDHRPGTDKIFNVSNALRYSVKEILAEIDKCDAVCALCHRERTHQRLAARGEESPSTTPLDE